MKPEFILRLGIAFTFLYAGISSLLSPLSWIGFVPDFVEFLLSKELFLILYSISEIILGIWLLSKWKVFYSSLISSILLLAITLPNITAMDIIFRDIGLFLAAVSLTLLNKK